MLSIIVPVYNVEKYIEKCITSILHSSYSDIEIILVDDGSEDSSGLICDNYALLDARIKVIHKENGGLVSARKAGVEIASGKYITFVDGDDYIGINLYQDLFTRMEENDGAEMVAFSYVFATEDAYTNQCIIHHSNKVKNVGTYNNSNIKTIIDDNYEIKIVNGVVAKIFITDILKKTILNVNDNITKAEDLAITLTYLPECKKIVLAEDISGYYYVQRKSSISHKYDSDSIARTANFIDCIMNYIKRVDVLDEWKKVIYNEGYSIIMSDCVGCCFKYYGKMRLLSILKYFHDMNKNEVLRNFYKTGVKGKYFANDNRMEYARLMAEGHYSKAFIKRVRKKY